MATQVDICNLALRRLGAQTISSITEGTKNADHCSAFWEYVLDEVLEDYPWNFAKKHRRLDYSDGFGVYTENDWKTISNITQADPGVVTCPTHQFESNMTVYFKEIEGMTELNTNTYEITKVDANSFQITDINTTNFSAYASCGKCIRKELLSDYEDQYTYDLPTDYLRALYLEGESTDYEILGTGDNRRLVTSTEDAVLVYLCIEDEPSHMVTRFISAMAYRLAAELAIPLSKKSAVADNMFSLFEYVMNKKITADASVNRRYTEPTDPWITAGGYESS